MSGVAVTSYTVDGGAAQTYPGTPFMVSGNGSHTVTYYSVDAAGNIGDARTPATSTSTPRRRSPRRPDSSADDDSGWTSNTAPTVTLSATDTGGSGVSATYYTVDDGDQTTYAGAFTVSGDGQHEVDYWSVDAMGNTEATHTGYVNIDTTAPDTTASGLMPDSSSGWRNTGQTVSLSGDDDGGCGVAATYYTVDGGATQTYSNPFIVSTQGSHVIAYWSVDAVGNLEAANSRLRQHRHLGADRDQQRRQRVAQQRCDRHAEPGRHRRQRRGLRRRSACRAPRAGHDDRQRVRRAGPGRPLRRRSVDLRVPGARRGRQREQRRHLHREDRHPRAGDHGLGPAGRQPLRLAQHEPRQ